MLRVHFVYLEEEGLEGNADKRSSESIPALVQRSGCQMNRRANPRKMSASRFSKQDYGGTGTWGTSGVWRLFASTLFRSLPFLF